jgi:hypothetical protein
MELNYASNAKANAGLATGIIGTALGALNATGGNLLGGIMGGCNGCTRTGGCGGCGYSSCSENNLINRYEASQQARIAELETEVKLRDANFYTLSEMGKLRDYVDGKFDRVEAQLCHQASYNATNTATINCMAGQIAQLQSLTKLVVPNSSVCPGWGDVTITPATAPTTAG